MMPLVLPETMKQPRLVARLSALMLAAALPFTSNLVAAGHAVRRLEIPAGGRAGFSLLQADQAGVAFSGAVERKDFKTTQFIDNAGIAAGDVDGDGWCDLFFCAMTGEHKLYRNRGGWKFEDVTESAGLAGLDRYLNAAAFADVDGDGDMDLIAVSFVGRNAFFLNDGKGRFTESDGIPWAVSKVGGETSLALADIDGDGDLDLYTTLYLNTIVQDKFSIAEFDQIVEPQLERIRNGGQPTARFLERYTLVTNTVNGQATIDLEENGVPDALYINDGKGRFTLADTENPHFLDDVGKPVAPPPDWGVAATFRDMDADGDPDLYVCNDFWTPDRIWINDGKGVFRPIGKLAVRRTSAFSMGVDFGDINRDGHVDFMVTDMLSRDHSLRKRQMGEMKPTPVEVGVFDDRPQIMQNTLFLNRGDNTWTEIAQFAGVKASEWSWQPTFLDVDLDGYEDLLVATGMIRDYTDADAVRQAKGDGTLDPETFRKNQALYPRLDMPTIAFRNRGDLTFEETGPRWGLDHASVSGGMVTADLDRDGDADLVINNTGSAPEIYRNNATGGRISVRLSGKAPNTRGVGARVSLLGGGLTQSREMIAGGVYASGSEPVLTFAAKGEGPFSIEVVWRNGNRSLIEAVAANHEYLIEESGSGPRPAATESPVQTVFADVSNLIDHRHHDTPFDDFKRQPLLPNRLSQLGPAVGWMDLDYDGDDDLVVGTGADGKLALMMNMQPNGFFSFPSPQLGVDLGTVVSVARTNGQSGLLVAMSNYEKGQPELPAGQVVHAAGFTRWQMDAPLPGSESSSGAATLADIDGDGDLDAFFGGRVIPGRYPEPATSRIYRWQEGVWSLDETNRAILEKVGLVSGAVFGDFLDGDGDSDLALACEWGPIKVFRNDKGKLTEATRELGLSSYSGWWNGVALGDIDGDGRLDLIASNWGRNSKYEHSYSLTSPLKIHYGDFDGSGTVDLVESHFDKRMKQWVPERGFSCSSRAMPFVGELGSYAAFGGLSVEGIYGDRLKGAKTLEANTLDHMVFFNRGEKFEGRALPVEAQLAPAFGVCVADYDGDGHEDIFLSQNFYSSQIETPRSDGGRGLWLRGLGGGRLEAVPGHVTGVMIYGEQRGAAIGDYDRDGRVDLLVAQNGAQTRLFHNQTGKPGLRVRLIGKGMNFFAVGARLRLKFGDRYGPMRSVDAGSGYWSQNSLTQVLAAPQKADRVQVFWPGGGTTESDVPENAHDIAVRFDGKVGVAPREGWR